MEWSITAHKFFLIAKSLDYDSDEELNKEQTNNNNENHEVDNHDRITIFDRLIVGLYWVNWAPHYVDPTLSCLYSYQC